MDFRKLSTGLRGTIGKTISNVAMVQHSGGQFRLFLVFTDGTHYELYGDGFLSGARSVEPGDAAEVRQIVTRSKTAEVAVVES